MAKGNSGSKAGQGSSNDQNTQDGANARSSDASEMDLGTDETQGTGAKSMAVESGQAKAPAVRQDKAGKETKQKWLNEAYTFRGEHYGPSKYPGDLITVPADFPDDKGGNEPAPSEWTPAASSAVVEREPDNNEQNVL